MITGFPSKKIYNTGGYSSFEFLPYNLVYTYPMITQGVTYIPVGLYEGHPWLKGYATAGSLVFTEEQVVDENGQPWNQTINGFVPGDKAELVFLMANMARTRYLVLLRDSSGQMRLVGTPKRPLKFTSSYGSGGERSEQKGYHFKFTAQSLFPAPAYKV